MSNLSDAEEFYALAKDAYAKALKSKKYGINTGASNRSLERQTLSELKTDMLYWRDEAARLSSSNTGIKTKFIISNQ